MEDEYKLYEVLGDKYPELLEPLTEHLDKYIGVYLDKEKEHAKAHAREAYCYLTLAIIASEEGDCDLKEELNDILDGYQKVFEG